MNNFESQDSWLRQLGELNDVIAEAGEPLMGNLFYDHLQENYLGSPPNPILRPKRDRFRKAVAGRTRLLEVGVNGGHSAFLALTSDPEIEVHGVDICEHAYARPAADWLKRNFPGRMFFHVGDCRMVLPQLARQGLTFDAFHIDGAKFTYYEDVCNCQRMVGAEAVVIVDDSQLDEVSRVLGRCVRQGRIQPVPEFPSMPTSIKYRHEIGKLKPAPAWRSVIFRLLWPARRLRWSTPVQGLEATLARLEATASRRTRRQARRVASFARHPVAVIRRRVLHRVEL